MDLNRFCRVTKALSHPVRLEIVQHLLYNPDGLPTTTVADMVHSDPGATSNHLSYLARHDLVYNERNGKFSIQKINRETLHWYLTTLNRLLNASSTTD